MVPAMITLSVIPFALFCALVRGDACAPNPCQNQGTCTRQSLGGVGFNCSCIFGFYGDTCEHRSKCTFKHIVEGVDNTDHIDIAALSGLDMKEVDACKERCQSTIGCRAIDYKRTSCNVFWIVPLSVSNITPMTSEKGRVFALRRCYKRKQDVGIKAHADRKQESSVGNSEESEGSARETNSKQPENDASATKRPGSADNGHEKVMRADSKIHKPGIDTRDQEAGTENSDTKDQATGAESSASTNTGAKEPKAKKASKEERLSQSRWEL